MNPEVTLLMPCLNEAETIAFCIQEAMSWAQENEILAEILIADNGSYDNSASIAKHCGATVVEISEKGYGNAVHGGILAAKGKYIIMGDCDKSYNFMECTKLLEKLRQGYALVVGNRFRGGIQKGAMPFLHRYFGVPLLSFMGRVRYNAKIGDFHCGLRGFDREKALTLGLCQGGMEFATEIIGKFAEKGEKICEVPVMLRQDGRNRASHLRTFADGWRHLKWILFKK